MWKSAGVALTGKVERGVWVCWPLGQELDDQGAPMAWKQNGLCSMINIRQIVLAKSHNASGASHQPAFIGSCLTISHACLSCLPSR